MGVTSSNVDTERPKGNKPKRPHEVPQVEHENEKRGTLKQQIGLELVDMAKDRTIAAETRLGAIKVLRGMFPADF